MIFKLLIHKTLRLKNNATQIKKSKKKMTVKKNIY